MLMPPGQVAVSIPLVGQDPNLVLRRIPVDTLGILFHALTQCQRWHRLAVFTFMAAVQVHLAQTNHHGALATCHPPPDSEFGDPEWGPLCVRDMLRKATFSRLFGKIRKSGFDASHYPIKGYSHLSLDAHSAKNRRNNIVAKEMRHKEQRGIFLQKPPFYPLFVPFYPRFRQSATTAVGDHLLSGTQGKRAATFALVTSCQ